MATTILPDRLKRFNSPDVHLRSGAGAGADSQIDVCAMQAVAWLAGEPNTARPQCACPVIAKYVTRLNDSRLFANHRDLIKPYCPRIAGTRSTRDVERKRAFIAADFAVRSFAPTVLRALKREEWAAALEGVAPITDKASVVAAQDTTREVRKAAVAVAAAAAAVFATDVFATEFPDLVAAAAKAAATAVFGYRPDCCKNML